MTERRGGDHRRLVDDLERRTGQVRCLLDELERRQEAEREGQNFTAPTEEQLRKKLSRTNSPWIALTNVLLDFVEVMTEPCGHARVEALGISDDFGSRSPHWLSFWNQRRSPIRFPKAPAEKSTSEQPTGNTISFTPWVTRSAGGGCGDAPIVRASIVPPKAKPTASPTPA